MADELRGGRLTAPQVAQISKPGMYHDANGLYLQVTAGPKGPRRSWIYRYYLGKARQMGLGSAKFITLAEARELAWEAARMRARGIDPISHKEGLVPTYKVAPKGDRQTANGDGP